MIIHRTVIRRIIKLIIAAFLVSGCTNVMVTAKDIPSLKAGSPLRSTSPKTFAFKEFNDVRNVDDPLLILGWCSTRCCRFESAPSAIVLMLIKKEFERNGHKCITYSSNVTADFIVEGSFYKNLLVLRPGLIYSEFYTKTGVKLTISRISGEKNIFVKSYEGDGTIHGAIDSLELAKSSAREALLSLIKEISADLELIEFLKKHP
jgi:hypothetical protein